MRCAIMLEAVVLSVLSGLPAVCQTALPPGSLARPLARVVLHPRPSRRPLAVGLGEGGLNSRQIAGGHVVLLDQGAVEEHPVPVLGGGPSPQVEGAAPRPPRPPPAPAGLPPTPLPP